MDNEFGNYAAGVAKRRFLFSPSTEVGGPSGIAEGKVVGLYPTSQAVDFAVATALAEFSRRQKAPIGSGLRQVIC